MCRVVILHTARIPARLGARLGVVNRNLVLTYRSDQYGFLGKCSPFASEPRIGQIHHLTGRLAARDLCSMPSKGK
jgi:hypothetical protein